MKLTLICKSLKQSCEFECNDNTAVRELKQHCIDTFNLPPETYFDVIHGQSILKDDTIISNTSIIDGDSIHFFIKKPKANSPQASPQSQPNHQQRNEENSQPKNESFNSLAHTQNAFSSFSNKNNSNLGNNDKPNIYQRKTQSLTPAQRDFIQKYQSIPVDPIGLETLMNMGFDQKRSEVALKMAKEIDTAIYYLSSASFQDDECFDCWYQLYFRNFQSMDEFIETGTRIRNFLTKWPRDECYLTLYPFVNNIILLSQVTQNEQPLNQSKNIEEALRTFTNQNKNRLQSYLFDGYTITPLADASQDLYGNQFSASQNQAQILDEGFEKKSSTFNESSANVMLTIHATRELKSLIDEFKESSEIYNPFTAFANAYRTILEKSKDTQLLIYAGTLQLEQMTFIKEYLPYYDIKTLLKLIKKVNGKVQALSSILDAACGDISIAKMMIEII